MRIAIDSEFSFDANNDFVMVCVCVKQEDGLRQRFWRNQAYDLKKYLQQHTRASKDILVAHNVEYAEAWLVQSLGMRATDFYWHDTLVESRIAYNRCIAHKYKHGLAKCLEREGLCVRDPNAKKEDQKLCVWEPTECTWEQHLAKLEANKEHLLDYCMSDVEYLLQLDDILLRKMRADERLDRQHHMDMDRPLPFDSRATYWGFLAAFLGESGWQGIPMKKSRVDLSMKNAPAIIADLQNKFNDQYKGTFHIKDGKLKADFDVIRALAAKQYGANPPLTPSGLVSLKDEYVKQYKDTDTFLGHYRELNKTCKALASFAKPTREKNWLGGYNPRLGIIRPHFNLGAAATGRLGMQPSSGFCYTMGKPFRGLVCPKPGKVIVELDFHSEEIACQAYLSGDKVMTDMYRHPKIGNDYYTTLANSIDPDVTYKKHPKRGKYKIVSLMLNYGAGARKLSSIVGLPLPECKRICLKLKRQFKQYWMFVDRAKAGVNRAVPMWFSDGWRIHSYPSGKQTTLGNFPFQGVGAYILRLILLRMWKEDIRLVAPIHDAVAFECDEATWKETTAKVVKIMMDCSEKALGIPVEVGAPEVTYPDIINCHSELETRENYAFTTPNKYAQSFTSWLEFEAEGCLEPDLDEGTIWVDEFDEDEENSPSRVANPFGLCYISQ